MERIVTECSTGTAVYRVMEAIEDGHPQMFWDADGGPALRDEAGNLLRYHTCPGCGAQFTWCIDGPHVGRLTYEARLLKPCPFEEDGG